jgi:preprotein translocase subunit SecA
MSVGAVTHQQYFLSEPIQEKYQKLGVNSQLDELVRFAENLGVLQMFESEILSKMENFSLFSKPSIIDTCKKIFSSSPEVVTCFFTLATKRASPYYDERQFSELLHTFSAFIDAFLVAERGSFSLEEVPYYECGGKKWLEAQIQLLTGAKKKTTTPKEISLLFSARVRASCDDKSYSGSHSVICRRIKESNGSNAAGYTSVHIKQFFSGGLDLFVDGVGGLFGGGLLSRSHTKKYVSQFFDEYDISKEHFFRIVDVLDAVLPSSDPCLAENVETLLFLIAKIKEKIGTTSFLLMTQPSSFEKGKPTFQDVLQFFQNILQLHDLGRIDQEVYDTMHNFHSASIEVSKMLEVMDRLREKAEKDAAFSSLQVSGKEVSPLRERLEKAVSEKKLTGSDCARIERILEALSWKRKASDDSIESLVDVFIAAKKQMREEQFDLIVNPLCYQNTRSIKDVRNLMHQCKIILNLGGTLQEDLRIFYAGRMSVQSFDKSLEMKKVAISDERSPEGNFEEILTRFSCSELEKKSMRVEYEHIFHIGKDLRALSIDQLISQAKDIQKRCLKGPLTQEDSRLLIGLARESIRKEFGMYPYSTQMLALIGIIQHPHEYKGRIAQVKTGEGKSTIIAMLALYLTCQGLTVDIISSSRYLAQRDEEKYREFFNLFGITTSNLCVDSPNFSNFLGQIMYGTNFDFEFAIMRDYFSSHILRTFKGKERPFNAVIVDEVDNMFIDNASSSARISIPGTDSLTALYKSIFLYVRENQHRLEELLHERKSSLKSEILEEIKKYIGEEKCVYPNNLKNREFSDAEAPRFDSGKSSTLLDIGADFSESKMGVSVKEKTDSSGYLGIDSQKLEMLLMSALRALSCVENEEYVVKPLKDVKESVVIVDKNNTGRLSENSRWQRGLHQFLELKHGLDMKEETLMPSSLSHPIYFGMYDRIYGLTGTVGGNIEREEVAHSYRVDVIDVPPHRLSLRKDLDPVIVSDEEQYQKVLEEEIQNTIRAQRPTLILFETIQQTKFFQSALEVLNIPCQTVNARQSEEEDFLITKAGLPGAVTLATNTAGRGTDIIPSPESLKAGGLHVILTYLPRNQRVEAQGLGRAGRQGQPGSTRIIMFLPQKVVMHVSSGKDQYSRLLARRDALVAKESQERQLRAEIESMNNEYLQRFVNQFRAGKTKAPEVEQVWAEHFYSRLDDLLWNVERRSGMDQSLMLATYKKELYSLFEKEKINWEALL